MIIKGESLMKMTWKALAAFLFSIALISGCGTKESSEKANSSVPVKEQKEKENHPLSTNEQNQEEKQTPSSEKQLSYTIDGKKYEETAFLKTSDNQGFSLYTLKGWELEAEEPNSDVLLKDDMVVRIRLIHPEGSEMDYAQLVEDQAKAISSSAVRQDTTHLSGMFQQSVWYKVHTEDTAVNVIGVNKPIPMMFTIQTPRNKEVLAPILAMLETITKTETSKSKEKTTNPDEPTSSPASSLPSTHTITYTVNGQETKATGTLYTSSNQPFHLYVLPNYKADAVEPHLDRIYIKGDEQYYMDIECLGDDIDWNQVEFETMEKMKAIDKQVTTSISSESHPLFAGMTVYHTHNEDHWTEAFLIKNNAHYPNMRITIHLPKEDSHLAEFLAMAKTISSQY